MQHRDGAITEDLRRDGQVEGLDGGQREGDHGMHVHKPSRDLGLTAGARNPIKLLWWPGTARADLVSEGHHGLFGNQKELAAAHRRR